MEPRQEVLAGTIGHRRLPPNHEQPGLEVVEPTPARDHAAVAPEVYSATDFNPSQFTFYREGTPPPSIREKGQRSSGIRGGIPGGLQSPRASTAEESEDDEADATICGLRKLIFFLIIVVAGVIIFVIAIGVGIGVSLRERDQSAPSPTQTLNSLTTGLATPTSTSTAPMAASTDCPEGNGTIYNVPGSTISFLRVCSIDYSGPGEAVDLANLPTSSMNDCMDNCAGEPNCTGCGWGFIEGDIGNDYACWMKTDLGNHHEARTNWSFGILLNPQIS